MSAGHTSAKPRVDGSVNTGWVARVLLLMIRLGFGPVSCCQYFPRARFPTRFARSIKKWGSCCVPWSRATRFVGGKGRAVLERC